MNKLLLFVALTMGINSNPVNGQVTNEERIEFELREGFEGFQMTEFKENGMLVSYHEDKGVNGMINYRVEHYSTDLGKTNEVDFDIPKEYNLARSTHDDTRLVLFFVSKRNEYKLLTIDSDNLTTQSFSGALPRKTYYSKLSLLNDLVYVYCSSKAKKYLKLIHLDSGKDEDLELGLTGYRPSMISVENIQIEKTSGEFFLFLNVGLKKDKQVYVQRYNSEGDLQESFNLSDDQEKFISSVSASYIDDGEYIFTGTYSSRNSTVSEGIYFCKTTNGKKDFMKYYNYSKFQNFFNYLPERKQEKVEKKIKKKEAQGKEMRFNYLMASHNVHYIDGKYIYIGEAYYPTYHTEYRTTYVNGTPTTTSYQVFDGYQYTHATVAAFDADGELLWDNTFKMYPFYKPFTVITFINITEVTDSYIGMVFSSGSTIKSMSIDFDGQTVDEKSYTWIDTGDEDDKVKSTFSKMVYWYGNNFIAYGTQTIKNKEDKQENGKAKRRVYFINKISYEI